MSKLMKRIFLAAGLVGLLASNSLQAQENRGRWGLILGGNNAVTYDRALSRHLEVSAMAGLELGLGYGGSSRSFQYTGLIPTLELTPRYYLVGKAEGQPFYKGLYLALRMGAEIDSWTLFPSRALRESPVKAKYTLGVTPTVGCSMALSEKSYLRLGIELPFYRQKYELGGETHWVTQKGSRSIHLEFSYGFAI